MSQYKKALVLGATSGIGKALAEKFVENGTFVIIGGRREDILYKFVRQHGFDKAQAAPFDITKLDSIEAFTYQIMNQHPDIDCVVFNSGIQRKVDFSQPDSVDMRAVMDEHTTNYLSPLALTKSFLPYLLKKDYPTSIIYTGSQLGLVPLPRCLNYCASKAALHQFILAVREQLKHTNVKIIELLPPAVQTELHDAKHQPDVLDGHKIGIPLDEFTNEAWAGLSSDAVLVAVGHAQLVVDAIEPGREKMFQKMLEMLSGTINPHH